MFGYVRIWKPDLRVREYEAYRGVYCGICRALGKTCGLRARFLLGYDSVFLAMLLADVTGETVCFHPRRCPVHPLEKRACAGMGESVRYAGCAYLILLYHKLRDDVADSRSFRARLLLLWLRSAYRRAVKLYPETDAIAAAYVSEQQQAEGLGALPLDGYVDPSAKAMAKLLASRGSDESTARVLSRLGYMLGRWVYLMDAADDLPEDQKRGRFNALAKTLPAETLCDPDKLAERVVGSLRMTVSEMISAYALLPKGMFGSILENILYQGLGAEMRRVLPGAQRKGGAT